MSYKQRIARQIEDLSNADKRAVLSYKRKNKHHALTLGKIKQHNRVPKGIILMFLRDDTSSILQVLTLIAQSGPMTKYDIALMCPTLCSESVVAITGALQHIYAVEMAHSGRERLYHMTSHNSTMANTKLEEMGMQFRVPTFVELLHRTV